MTDKETVLKNEHQISTKELAETLGVNLSTIQKTVNRLNKTYAVLPTQVKGRPTYFNEEQATLIKREIQRHHNLASRQIDNILTTAEEDELINKAVLILQRRSEKLRADFNKIVR